MDVDYLRRRQKNLFSRWKLKKRCEVVYRMIRKYFDNDRIKILDVGSCDGKMLSYIKDRLPFAECYGIEPKEEFIKSAEDTRICLKVGVAEKIDFPDNSFDVVILSSVLEHIKEPQRCLNEVRRVLKPMGKFILLTVVPEYESLAVKLGIKKDDHFQNFSLSLVNEMVEKAGFIIIESKKLKFPLFYQLTIGEKNG
jgi:demethylmenaquinone methyltransferase/2-methoxy-6-polyprenyl-1,4-benzoquinol methylase